MDGHAVLQNDADFESNNAVSVKLYIYLFLIVSGLNICVYVYEWTFLV
jgi:hypothetical protein